MGDDKRAFPRPESLVGMDGTIGDADPFEEDEGAK